MLKIKDDVDLKELEKFGFEYVDMHKEYMLYDGLDEYLVASVNPQNKFIYFFSSSALFGYDFIFDLIQAGLVEKVEEQE